MNLRHLPRIACFTIVAVLCLGHTEAAESGGCGGGGGHAEIASGATCPETDAPTAASFGTAFMQTYCLSCHSASVTGSKRESAPPDFNFDTVEDVRFHAMHIDEHAASGPSATNTEMPPANKPKPTLHERELLGQWLACGAP